MNRFMLIAIGAGLIGLIVFAGLIVTGGLALQENPASSLVRDAPVVAPAPTVEITASQVAAPKTVAVAPLGDEVEDVVGRALFEAWSTPLRATGLEVAAEWVSSGQGFTRIAGLEIASGDGGIDWIWRAREASLVVGSANETTLFSAGVHEFSATSGPFSAVWSGRGQVHLGVQSGEVRPFTSVLVEVSDLSLDGVGGAGLIALKAGSLHANIGATKMPASSLRATGLVLPLWVNVPFGSKVDQVTAELDLSETAERSTPVRIIELAWGVLRLSGSGTIGFDDETRLAGRLDVSIDDPLAILDAVHAMWPLDREGMARTYAVSLEAMSLARSTQETIAIVDGAIGMTGTFPGLGQVNLGKVRALVAGASAP